MITKNLESGCSVENGVLRLVYCYSKLLAVRYRTENMVSAYVGVKFCVEVESMEQVDSRLRKICTRYLLCDWQHCTFSFMIQNYLNLCNKMFELKMKLCYGEKRRTR